MGLAATNYKEDGGESFEGAGVGGWVREKGGVEGVDGCMSQREESGVGGCGAGAVGKEEEGFCGGGGRVEEDGCCGGAV